MHQLDQINVAYMRFIYLLPTENFIYEQLRHLRSFNPIVLCIRTANLDRFPCRHVYALTDLNPILCALNRVFLSFFGYSPYFEQMANKMGVQLLHALFGEEGAHAVSFKEKLALPLITDFRGYDASRLPIDRPGIYKELFAKGDLFLARSQHMAKDLVALGCPGDKLRVLHSGVNLDKFKFRERKPMKGEPIRVLLVGRLVEKKGVQYAIQAVSKVNATGKNIQLTIIGEGPLRKTIEELISDLGLTNVTLLGQQPHSAVITAMASSHIFVLPSVTAPDGDKEGIPNSVIEAQASGLPVIATHHAGLPEAVIDGETGYLVKERDSEALAERLCYLIEHQELWAEMGRKGRRLVEEAFNIQTQVQKLEEIYREILAG